MPNRVTVNTTATHATIAAPTIHETRPEPPRPSRRAFAPVSVGPRATADMVSTFGAAASRSVAASAAGGTLGPRFREPVFSADDGDFAGAGAATPASRAASRSRSAKSAIDA
jgi:hypothetical protein